MNGGARAESGVRGVVPARDFRSGRGGGSRVERLGRFAIKDKADVLMTRLLVREKCLYWYVIGGPTLGEPYLIRSKSIWHACIIRHE